ncbi:hypothetical protein LVD17_24510 [Fulvivirga ulvae]|uniref:hypothetical protein n=1 Tax=Fulvivirga ulvae TaxID=2904245 RepID=UPI001F16C885|nr:hypothetical protein [Fulvivirga ulvae]UII31459.1 hypothetical protein LVD17_24510 [Fulvivirga ulvae]
MKQHRQIIAFLFLIIISIFNAHDIFPHVHHQHIDDVNDHTHHQTEHHHHSASSESDHDEESFLDLIFKNHSHNKHSHQYTPATIERVKTGKQIEIKALGNNDSYELTIKETDVGLHGCELFIDFGSDDPYLYSNPLRGPPALG